MDHVKMRLTVVAICFCALFCVKGEEERSGWVSAMDLDRVLVLGTVREDIINQLGMPAKSSVDTKVETETLVYYLSGIPPRSNSGLPEVLIVLHSGIYGGERMIVVSGEKITHRQYQDVVRLKKLRLVAIGDTLLKELEGDIEQELSIDMQRFSGMPTFVGIEGVSLSEPHEGKGDSLLMEIETGKINDFDKWVTEHMGKSVAVTCGDSVLLIATIYDRMPNGRMVVPVEKEVFARLSRLVGDEEARQDAR